MGVKGVGCAGVRAGFLFGFLCGWGESVSRFLFGTDGVTGVMCCADV